MISFRQRLDAFFLTYHRNEIPAGSLTRAAVLVPIFEKSGEPHFLLTKRTEDVEHHKGQISFPGGSVDKGDGDITSTALRETEEEIGLCRSHIRVCGTMSDITIPTGFVVTPVVGFLDILPPLILNRQEVESVVEVPFSFLLEQKNKKIVKMLRGGILRDVCFFNFGEHQIWGATAAIIDTFLTDFVKNFSSGAGT
jgi:8-oxo-dGTP pyrophosphatase MutT (NUDIX family)